MLNVDWRAYAQTHTLTNRQRKLAEKIKKRENRITALQKEVDKIRVRMSCLSLVRFLPGLLWPASFCVHAKQTAMEKLAQKQAVTLVRNEQNIDKSMEEMEDLEEMLNESISDSMRSMREKASGQAGKKKKK